MAAGVSRAGIAILGCGAVGGAFARDLLHEREYRGRLVLWSRSRRSVRRLLGELRPKQRERVRVVASAAEAACAAAVVLVCVSDEGQAEVLRGLARSFPDRARRPVLLSASGSLPLAPLRRAAPGWSLGRLHPLAPVASPMTTLCHGPFAVEGDARALRSAHSVLRVVDGKALRLNGPEAARAYHAAAALLGGGVVALLRLAEEAMAPALEVERSELRWALMTFCEGNAQNVWLHGPVTALTGPIARGSEAVVAANLRALRRVSGAREAYRTLGLTMLALARQRGLRPAEVRTLRRLLAPVRGRRGR